MKYKEERDYLDGLAAILSTANTDKLKLNLEEMYRICIGNSQREELEIISGLLSNHEGIAEIRKSLRKGSSLSRDTLNKAAGIK